MQSGVRGFGAAFGALGFFVGNLVAMSAQSIAQSLIAALFALFGGSFLVLIEKLSESNQRKLAVGLFSISIGGLAGTYAGLYINEHRLFTPADIRAASSKPGEPPQKYLRSEVLATATAIDQKLRNGQIGGKEAYDQLLEAVRSTDK
jgi:hypothetical protein